MIGQAGVQSNTVAYNGCPLPPASYRPVAKSRNSPAARRERARQQELDRIRWQAEHDLYFLKRRIMHGPPP